MELSHIKLGSFNLFTIETGRFRLDGGAMFGVVPKTLWSGQLEADEKNRIPMAMRCLLIQPVSGNKLYLVDNGAGTKFDDKFKEIYQIDYAHSSLSDSLHYHGFDREDITDIIFTHLHFDHCGGTTYFDESGVLQHNFPNALYHVTNKHWETATHPNAREKASFLKENIEPLEQSGRLHLINEDYEFETGLFSIQVDGHTLGQQLPVIKAMDKTIVFVADLIPTHVHVPLPWIMGYDMYPVQTLKEKQHFLEKAVDEQWYLYMEHDAREELIQIQRKDGKYAVGSTYRLNDITG